MRYRYNNCFLARTDPKDVARTEGRTFLCSDKKRDSIPCVETAQVMMIQAVMMDGDGDDGGDDDDGGDGDDDEEGGEGLVCC